MVAIGHAMIVVKAVVLEPVVVVMAIVLPTATVLVQVDVKALVLEVAMVSVGADAPIQTICNNRKRGGA